MGIEVLPVKYGSPTKVVPGYDVQVLDDDGHAVKAGDLGNIVVKLPLPPGTLPTLWHNDEGFRQSYLTRFPGYYNTGDAGFIKEDGYLFILTRDDKRIGTTS